MTRAFRLLALVIMPASVAVGCASNQRPELVPGSTITTTTTTSIEPENSSTTSTVDESTDSQSEESTTTTTTSIPRLDPDSPDYATTAPPTDRQLPHPQRLSRGPDSQDHPIPSG